MLSAITWRFGIGDPTLVGWITTIAYGISAFLCIRAGHRNLNVIESGKIPAGSPESAGEAPALPWFVCATGLILLGLNKQLDLQTLMIELGRKLAIVEGWYPERRRIQLIFVFILTIGGGVGLLALAWKQKRFFIRHPSVLGGIALLLLYVLLRVISIEHVGESRGLQISDKAWWLVGIELCGIVCIGFSAGAFAIFSYPLENRRIK